MMLIVTIIIIIINLLLKRLLCSCFCSRLLLQAMMGGKIGRGTLEMAEWRTAKEPKKMRGEGRHCEMMERHENRCEGYHF